MSLCVGHYRLGGVCYFTSNVLLEFDYNARAYLSDTAITNNTYFVPFSGHEFPDASSVCNNSIVSMDSSACEYYCAQNPSCTSYNYFDRGTTSIAGPPSVIGYLVEQITRVYYQQIGVMYQDALILELSGNITFCDVACDALPTCVGYNLNQGKCQFNSYMNKSNYIINSTSISMLLNQIDLFDVDDLIRESIEKQGVNITTFNSNSPQLCKLTF